MRRGKELGRPSKLTIMQSFIIFAILFVLNKKFTLKLTKKNLYHFEKLKEKLRIQWSTCLSIIWKFSLFGKGWKQNCKVKILVVLMGNWIWSSSLLDADWNFYIIRRLISSPTFSVNSIKVISSCSTFVDHFYNKKIEFFFSEFIVI